MTATANSVIRAAIALALIPFPTHSAPSISSITTTYSAAGTPTAINIAGSGFCSTAAPANCATIPAVTLGGTTLAVSAAKANVVTATLPLLATGDYLLSLTAGTTGSVTYSLTVGTQGTGATGPTGPTGPPGAAGAKGATGATGAAGAAGAAGAKGATGATGPTGPAGMSGSATVSIGTTTTGAAGSAANVSNTGTTTAAKLNFTIPQGAAGATGATGPIGPQGSVGPTGSSGPQGPVGPQGSPGATGPDGAQGLQGVSGSQGPTGPTGPTGAPGPIGTAGKTGGLSLVDSAGVGVGIYYQMGVNYQFLIFNAPNSGITALQITPITDTSGQAAYTILPSPNQVNFSQPGCTGAMSYGPNTGTMAPAYQSVLPFPALLAWVDASNIYFEDLTRPVNGVRMPSTGAPNGTQCVTYTPGGLGILTYGYEIQVQPLSNLMTLPLHVVLN